MPPTGPRTAEAPKRSLALREIGWAHVSLGAFALVNSPFPFLRLANAVWGTYEYRTLPWVWLQAGSFVGWLGLLWAQGVALVVGGAALILSGALGPLRQSASRVQTRRWLAVAIVAGVTASLPGIAGLTVWGAHWLLDYQWVEIPYEILRSTAFPQDWWAYKPAPLTQTAVLWILTTPVLASALGLCGIFLLRSGDRGTAAS